MQSSKFTHHVLFFLKDPESTADRDALMAGMKKLAAISAIRQFQIGLPVPSERSVVDSSWSVSMLTFFDGAADEETYQNHPVHLEFIENCKHLWERVVVFDALG